MAEPKTEQTTASVAAFLDGIADASTRSDCNALVAMMRAVTGKPPRMWGASIVGFGECAYPGSGGKTSQWFHLGFSPRKQNLTIYVMSGFEPFPDLMRRLGKHALGRSCLYVKRLVDVDKAVLEELLRRSLQWLQVYEAEARPASEKRSSASGTKKKAAARKTRARRDRS